MQKNYIFWAAFLMLSAVFYSCQEKPGPEPDPGNEPETPVNVERIVVEPSNLSLTIGETYQLSATVSPENADYEEIVWESSDEAIAVVDETGKVTAVSAGEVLIRASVDDKSSTCDVTVNEPIKKPDINFVAMSGSYNSSGQVMNVTLEAEDGSSIYLKMNISGELSGLYVIDDSGSGKTITGAGESGVTDGASYYISVSGEKQYLSSGELDIEIPSGDYISIGVAGEVTMVDGLLVAVDASEIILPEMKHYELVAGDLFYYGLNDNGTSLFCIYLKDSDTVGDGSMTFNTCIYATTPTMEDIDNLYLPDGKYVSAPGTYEEFTINDKDAESMKGFWYTLEPDMVTHYLLRGYINVSKSADIYTITGEYLETEYSGCTFSFVGTLIAEDYS